MSLCANLEWFSFSKMSIKNTTAKVIETNENFFFAVHVDKTRPQIHTFALLRKSFLDTIAWFLKFYIWQ